MPERRNVKELKKNYLRQRRKKRKALQLFVEYVLGEYYNGVDEYGNQIEESSREESFEHRWNKARAILLKSK